MCLCVLAVVLALLFALAAFVVLVVYSVPVARAIYALAASLVAAYPRLALLVFVFSLVAACGDALVTRLLRTYARDVVGDRVEFRWSVRQGVLELKHIAHPQSLLPALEPIVGFPVGFESVEIQLLAIELPLIDRFVYRSRQSHPRVRLAGLQIHTTLFASERYDWKRRENAARLQEAIQDAARARLARIDAWTALIVQKLAALAPPASAVRAPAVPTHWSKLTSRIVNSLAVDIQDVRLTIRDETKASSSVCVTLEALTVSRSGQHGPVSSQRSIKLTRFKISMHPRERLLFKARAVAIDAVMERSALLRTLTLAVSPTLHSVFPFWMHPRHLLFTRTSVLQSLHLYSNWYKHAVARDQQTCVDLTTSEASEYVQLFYEQWTLDATAGATTHLITTAERKRALATRRARIKALETKAHALQILALRAKALRWTLPRSKDALRRSNVSEFLETLVETYAHERRETPDDAPWFHRVDVTISVWSMLKRIDVTNRLHVPPPASVKDPFAASEPFFSYAVAWALDKRESIASLW